MATDQTRRNEEKREKSGSECILMSLIKARNVFGMDSISFTMVTMVRQVNLITS